MALAASRGGGSRESFGIEPLEARIVLASAHDLAVVGMTYDAGEGYVPYLAELVWDEDRTVSGDLWTAGDSGPIGPALSPITDMVNGPWGSAVPFFADSSFSDPPEATRFLSEDGYPVGWLGRAEGADDTARADVAAVVERASDAQVSDLLGSWSFQITQIESGGVYTRHGQATFNAGGGFFSLATGASGDPIWVGEGFEFAGEPVNGRFGIGLSGGDAAAMYLSADKSIILIADIDGSDGDTWMGIGLRQGLSLTDAELVGSYRVGVLYEGQDLIDGANMSDLDDGLPTMTSRLDLNADGTFELYDLEEADMGDLSDVNASGPWTHSDGVVTLTDTETGIKLRLKMSANGVSGIVLEFEQNSPTVIERPMSVVTKFDPTADEEPDTVLPVGILDLDGVPMVFDLRESTDTWHVVDFERYARQDLDFWMDQTLGANPGDIEAFLTSDDRLLAAVTTDDGLFAFARDEAGFWRSRNLTVTMEAAQNIVSTITVFTDRDGVAYVAGLTEAGDMVTYEFDPEADQGNGAWGYTNISQEHLAPQGESTPVFVGPIMSYVTSWNGLNIAGLAADGSIQAVWTGNGGRVWHASNLSRITGAPPMASGLTSYLTSWGGINIVGLDESGTVLASWWVPGFGGEWRIANLTNASGGPQFVGDSVTSFFTPWGATNVVGIDADGDLHAYWWTPNTNEWQSANLTASIPDGEPRPASQLVGQSNLTHGGEINIMGTDADTGELLRLFFRVDDNAWAVQNVSVEAQWV